MSKRRITVTLDESLVTAARTAVEQGRSESVSAFVNESLAARLEHDERMVSLGRLIADHEAEHGVITDRELAEQERRDSKAAEALRSDVLRRAG